MSGTILNQVVTDGLILYVDAANSSCYTDPNTTLKDLVSSEVGDLNTVVYDSNNYGSFSFDGVTSTNYISLSPTNPGRIPSLTLSTCSIETWVFPYATSINCALFTSSIVSPNTAYYGFSLYLGTWSDGSFYVSCHTGNGLGAGSQHRRSLETNTTPVTETQWNHIVATCSTDAFLTNIVMQIYVNGVLQSGTYSGTGFTLNWGEENGAKTFIGRKLNSDLPNIVGNISNTKMYNKVLSQAEVTQNYNALKKRFGL